MAARGGQDREITFVINGQQQPAGGAAAAARGTVRAAVRVGARRGGGDAVRVTARPGDDIVLLHIANGPTLYLHPADARELLRAQVGAVSPTGRGAGPLPPVDGDVVVPAQLGWRGLEGPAGTSAAARGAITDWLGDVVLDAVEVVTGLFEDKATDLVTAAVTRRLDGQVDAGVYRLTPQSLGRLKDSGQKVAQVPAPPDARDPILLLVHGTFVDTSSTFGNLWTRHGARLQDLFRHYGDRVYALDHPTVGTSPFGNALTLVRALPRGARLHLVTHSRGGIVAEALARICGGQGLGAADLALFDGPAYGQHREDLRALGAEIRERGIQVDRVVRVACPARGTLLASRRLDAYLSVLRWGLELAGVPVVPELVEFLSEVARRRADPAELPGLEAMMPGRPMAEWLNAQAEPVTGDLRVIAGDLEGDSLLSWLKTLLSDSFFWTDNDLVVQTRSMYGGTPRAGGAASFVLDRGGKVTHFNYFSNEQTVDAIARGLTQEQPADFRPIGPLSWAGEDASGTRAALASARSRAGDPAERPAVLVLPGILGSHLAVDGKRVWLSLRFVNGLRRLRWDAATAADVSPDGPVGASYDDLIEHLADTHEVVPFSFDWRRPIEDEARRLADAVDEALAARETTQQPVRIVAHSMGGIVTRTMRLERPETWQRMMARPGARVLMLGTPNGGSFAPMQVLSGDDTFGNLLSVFGSLFDAHGARQLIAGMPGLLQLQAALVDGRHGLDTAEGWERLQAADLDPIRARIHERAFWHDDDLQLESYRWGLPSQPVLDAAVALRKRLDEQRDLGADAAKVLLVVGAAPLTPADVEVTSAGVVYLDARDAGDGRVTFDNACLPGVRTWRVDVVHGDLADARPAFPAYVELLSSGDTRLLPVASPPGAARGAGARSVELVRSRPARAQHGDEPPAAQGDVFALAAARPPRAPSLGMRLRVTVVNGNLKFVSQPLLVGHYPAVKLTGTEWVIDRLLEGALSESLRAGLYPSAVGSSQVFVNAGRNADDPFVLPRPEAAIVIGMGEEGSLRMADLVETVRQGVLAYARRVSERGGGGAATFELAATLMGSGGTNVSTGASAQAIAIGVGQANQRLALVGWPQVSHLHLIELHLDRATEALQALGVLSDGQARGLVIEPRIRAGLGGLSRPLETGYRSAEYDFVAVETRGKDADATIEFSLATRRARDEVRGAKTQSKLVDELVRAGATDANQDPQIGRTLFKLLVPLELEPFLAGSAALLMQLDDCTARYPWELLDTQQDAPDRRDDPRPWAVRTRLLRKLRTPDIREQPHEAGRDGGVLVIGEPECDPERYPPLPGAVAEARAVKDVFQDAELVLNADALKVVKTVLDGSFRILHVAGHGDMVAGARGVVLSNGTTFGAREVESMRVVPELAFINCCHLGSFDKEPLRRVNQLGPESPTFAANVAEMLIRIGVRCVVAAGWAVDDDPAALFARTFYEVLHRGRPFVEAVGKAREATWSAYPRSHTWAAYQCYGDPNWTYVRDGESADAPRQAPVVASSEALVLQLDTLLVAHTFGDRPSDRTRAEIEQLESVYGGVWGVRGDVAAAFGAAYGEVRAFDRATDWYTRAIAAEDGLVRLRALEQLGNVRVRRGERLDDIDEARREIGAGIGLLTRVMEIAETVERRSLLGSACKRLALREGRAAREADGRAAASHASKAASALSKALEHYEQAEGLARRNGIDNLFYPAMNRMSIALVLSAGQPSPQGFDAADVDAVRQSLQKKIESDPDFWSVVGVTELRIYEALGARRLAPALDGILADLDDLMPRVTSSRMWDSVVTQARFYLTPYLDTPGVAEPERAAARALLQRLSGEPVAAEPVATKPRATAAKRAKAAKAKTTRRKRRG